MIDLQGIFRGLLDFFEQAPTGTRTQFINALESRGIATAAAGELFVDYFLDIAADMALISDADFDVLMTRVQTVGLAKATSAGRAVFARLKDLAAYRVDRLQTRVDIFQALKDELETKLPLIATGRAWVEANAPGSAALKAAVLQAIDIGVLRLTAVAEAAEEEIQRLEEQIQRLEKVAG